MLDLPAPPFRTGDVAYTRASPGGYASTASTPTDPAFSGDDQAYEVPALGGDFQPGSGTPAATASPVSKGSPADGGASAIASAPRVDVPPAPPPITPAELTGTVTGAFVVFDGVPTEDMTITVSFDDGTPRSVITYVDEGDSAGVVASKVTTRLLESGWATAVQTSNAVEVRNVDASALADLDVTVEPTAVPPEE